MLSIAGPHFGGGHVHGPNCSHDHHGSNKGNKGNKGHRKQRCPSWLGALPLLVMLFLSASLVFGLWKSALDLNFITSNVKVTKGRRPTLRQKREERMNEMYLRNKQIMEDMKKGMPNEVREESGGGDGNVPGYIMIIMQWVHAHAS